MPLEEDEIVIYHNMRLLNSQEDVLSRLHSLGYVKNHEYMGIKLLELHFIEDQRNPLENAGEETITCMDEPIKYLVLMIAQSKLTNERPYK